MMADADVIDDKSFVFGGTAYAVHAGNRLEEAVSDDDLVQIHHLLHRRIEAGQKHVVHDDDPPHASGKNFASRSARLVFSPARRTSPPGCTLFPGRWRAELAALSGWRSTCRAIRHGRSPSHRLRQRRGAARRGATRRPSWTPPGIAGNRLAQDK